MIDMKNDYLSLFTLFIIASCQADVNPRKSLIYWLEPKGPFVTIFLRWDPYYCSDGLPQQYSVELCTLENKCKAKETSKPAMTFESSDSFVQSFWKIYVANISIFCRDTGWSRWSSHEIHTGPGELPPLHGVQAIGYEGEATLTWEMPPDRSVEVADIVEIRLCRKAPRVCREVARTTLHTMEYKFEGLAPGVEHNAELSVNRHLRGSVYRSRSVFVEFTTKHRQVKNFQPVHNFTVNVLRKKRKVDLELGYKKPAAPPGAKFKGVIVNIVDRTKSPVVAGIMSNETRFTIRDLPYFALFTVKVRAVYRHADDIVESDEASQSVDTGAEVLLERPKILEAISINNRSALIRWSHIAQPGVKLSHKIVLNNEISIDILRSDIESIVIKDRLEPRRTYNATIIASFTYNGETRSIASEGKQFKMLPEDALVAKPAVENVKRNSVHLKWEVTLPDGAPKCEITVKYCSVSNGCSTTLISDMTTSSTILKTTPFLNYEITLNTTCSFVNDITVFGVSETVHVFTAALPGPPLGVSIATVGGRRIIRWTAETDERFDVKCYKINATALHGTERAVLLRTNPSFDLSALRPNIRYKVEISSCIDTAANTCGAPAVVETTTIAPTVVGYPSRPEVKLVSQSRGQLVFRWTEPTEPHGPIDGYEYAYGRKGDSFSPSNWISTGSDIRSAVVTRLQADTTYIIHVVAFNINFRGGRLYSLSGRIEVSTESS